LGPFSPRSLPPCCLCLKGFKVTLFSSLFPGLFSFFVKTRPPAGFASSPRFLAHPLCQGGFSDRFSGSFISVLFTLPAATAFTCPPCPKNSRFQSPFLFSVVFESAAHQSPTVLDISSVFFLVWVFPRNFYMSAGVILVNTWPRVWSYFFTWALSVLFP